MTFLLMFISALGLFVSLLAEQSQIIAKTQAGLSGQIANGYWLAMRIMIFNRVGSIIYVTSLSFAVDTGIKSSRILIIAAVVCLLLSIYNFVLFFKRFSLFNYRDEFGKITGTRIYVTTDAKYSILIGIAVMFNILGLVIPYYLSNVFPTYRLTLANSGFIFNTIFTLVSVLLLEKRFSLLLDSGRLQEVFIFASKTFLLRAVGALISAAILLCMLMMLGLDS